MPDITAVSFTGRAPYTSGVRSEQARVTRRAIVAAAGQLFVEQGYAATTIDAIAERAGVGRKTVFSSVGGKGGLLKLAWDWALSGDDEPIPMSERPAVRAMLAEHDPRRLVEMWVDMQLDVGERATPIGAVVMAAADVDPEVQALLDTIRHESLVGATAFVTHLAGVGGLRRDLSVERAADVCWALLNSVLMHLLVRTRGWSRHEYGSWLVRVVSTTLLEYDAAVADQRATPVRVVHEPSRERYEAWVDGQVVGQLTYQRTKTLVVLTRTDADFDDHGSDAASALVRRAMDDVAADGAVMVLPLCPYARWWINRHPELDTLVYDEKRSREEAMADTAAVRSTHRLSDGQTR